MFRKRKSSLCRLIGPDRSRVPAWDSQQHSSRRSVANRRKWRLRLGSQTIDGPSLCRAPSPPTGGLASYVESVRFPGSRHDQWQAARPSAAVARAGAGFAYVGRTAECAWGPAYRILPPTLLFDYPTIESLTLHLAKDVLKLELAAGSETSDAAAAGSKDWKELEKLTESEAETLLLAELDRANQYADE